MPFENISLEVYLLFWKSNSWKGGNVQDTIESIPKNIGKKKCWTIHLLCFANIVNTKILDNVKRVRTWIELSGIMVNIFHAGTNIVFKEVRLINMVILLSRIYVERLIDFVIPLFPCSTSLRMVTKMHSKLNLI